MNRREFLKSVVASAALAIVSPTLLPPVAMKRPFIEEVEEVILSYGYNGRLSWPEVADALRRLHEPGPHLDLIKAIEASQCPSAHKLRR